LLLEIISGITKIYLNDQECARLEYSKIPTLDILPDEGI
jgi:hypothetical protein